MITTQQVRIILDRNQNGLDGRPRVAVGQPMAVGVYWDEERRRVVPVESPRPADRPYVLLAHDLGTDFDELVRLLAMGGGGQSGRAIPYHAGVSHSHH